MTRLLDRAPKALTGPRYLDLADAEPLELEFRGSATDYFRIWIVNVCLTLLTLGVFSAWATVRTKRYFYSHTLLDGTPFRYLASPLLILQGRLVAVALFCVWYAVSHYALWLAPALLLSSAALAPWVIVRAAAFNARYSAFRNIPFEFTGTYFGACKVLASSLLLALSGIGIPWAYRNIRRFLTKNTHYAGVRGTLRLPVAELLSPSLAALVILCCSLAVTVFVVVRVFRADESPSELGLFAPFVPLYFGYAIAALTATVGFRKAAWRNTRLGPLFFDSTERTAELLLLRVTNVLACVLSVGLLIPWARVRFVRYRLSRLHIDQAGELDQFRNEIPRKTLRAAGSETATLFELDVSA